MYAVLMASVAAIATTATGGFMRRNGGEESSTAMTFALAAFSVYAAIQALREVVWVPDHVAWFGEIAGIGTAAGIAMHLVTALKADRLKPWIVFVAVCEALLSVMIYAGVWLGWSIDVPSLLYPVLVAAGMLVAGMVMVAMSVVVYTPGGEDRARLLLMAAGGAATALGGVIGLFHLDAGYPETDPVGWVITCIGMT
ncbi:hypothetical protein ACW9HQ_42305, partial [Nocardia gipuzkoensis]